MDFELISASHCVGESNLHLQFTPAYRRAVFARPRVKELVRAYLLVKAGELGVQVLAMEFGPDHLHVFVADWRNYSPEDLVRLLKGYISRMMRKNHWRLFVSFLWGCKFWSSGYFYRTVGSVTSKTIKFYIEQSQKKHWKNNGQKKLTNYAQF